MLPILRVIPVGGVLLAIAILILALNPPGDHRARLNGAFAPMTGALISRELHPEWPQMLWRAALQRADELRRLRELPETPVASAPLAPAPKAEKPSDVAAVPESRTDADPEDVTGTIVQTPAVAMPVDIGETSSTELPVVPHEEKTPVIMTPQRIKPPRESNAAPQTEKPAPVTTTAPPPAPAGNAAAEQAQSSAKKRVRHVRRIRPLQAKQQASTQVNFFDALFGSGSGQASSGYLTAQ